MAETYPLSFSNLGDRHGPLTWGQRHVQGVLRAHPENVEQFTLWRYWRVPRGSTTSGVLDALRSLITRHETLRTHLVPIGGHLAQKIRGSGQVLVPVLELQNGEWTRSGIGAVASEAAAKPYEPKDELPVRFRLLTNHGMPEWVTVAIPHAVIDGQSFEVLHQDFRALMTGSSTARDPAFQPVDWALREQSPRWRQVNQRNLTYIVDSLLKFPNSLFPATAGAPTGTSPFPVVLGRSAGLAARVERISRDWGVSTAAVCLASLARQIALHSEIDAFTLGITSSNRFPAGATGYVGMLAQNGVIVVEADDGPLRLLAERVNYCLLKGYRHSLYNQIELGEKMEEAGAGSDYAGFGAVGHFVNFVHMPSDGHAAEESRSDSKPEIVISEAEPVDYRILNFGIVISSNSLDLEIRMFLNPDALPPDTAKSLVRSTLEGLLL